MAEQNSEPEWKYNPDDNTSGKDSPKGTGQSQIISWTASEFIDKHKTLGWYLAFLVGIILLSGGIFLYTKDYMSTAAIAFAGIIFIFVTKKKPKQLPYEVNNQGIQIGSKFYQYGMFKSFDLAQDGGIRSIELIPLRRFMPEVSIYFPPEQEMAIVNVLADHLPHHAQTERAVDKLAKKLRF